jgi:hypothetical protein
MGKKKSRWKSGLVYSSLIFLFFDVTPYCSLFLHEKEIKEKIKIGMECA